MKKYEGELKKLATQISFGWWINQRLFNNEAIYITKKG